MRVALLDSGIGGWSFLKKLQDRYPFHSYLYFADQKNCPYGNKSVDELNKIVDSWIEILSSCKLDVLVLACNTLTAIYKDYFREHLNIPVIGTVDGIKEDVIKHNRTIVIATMNTVNTHLYKNTFPNSDIKEIGNTWLATTIEEHNYLTNTEKLRLKQEINKEAGDEWSNLILGCTHYPLIKKDFISVYPDKNILDPADYIHLYLDEFLIKQQTRELNPETRFFTTGEIFLYKEQISLYFEQVDRFKVLTSTI